MATLFRRLQELYGAQQLGENAALICIGSAAELEERQSRFDHHPDRWKKSRAVGRYARRLYRTHRLIARIEHLAYGGPARGEN